MHRGSEASAGPAPGDYSCHTVAGLSAPSFSMPRSARAPAASQRGMLPGPGYYHTPCLSDQHAPAFSMGAKLDAHSTQHEREGLPGPGEYDVHTTAQAPAFSIACKLSLLCEHGGAPVGPGQYNVLTSAPAAGPAYTMGAKASSTGGARARAHAFACACADASTSPPPIIPGCLAAAQARQMTYLALAATACRHCCRKGHALQWAHDRLAKAAAVLQLIARARAHTGWRALAA